MCDSIVMLSPPINPSDIAALPAKTSKGPKPKAASPRLPKDDSRSLPSDNFRFRNGPSDAEVKLIISKDAFRFLGGKLVFILFDDRPPRDVPSNMPLNELTPSDSCEPASDSFRGTATAGVAVVVVVAAAATAAAVAATAESWDAFRFLLGSCTAAAAAAAAVAVAVEPPVDILLLLFEVM
jgi:hypothetical protein